jgi:hypothetical protein
MTLDIVAQWWLVAQLPSAKPGTKFELEILREVDGDELADARRANALLNRLAQAAPYARLVELFQQVEAALARLGAKNPPSPPAPGRRLEQGGRRAWQGRGHAP